MTTHEIGVAVALNYYSCAPPFLGVEGGAVFLDLGGIFEYITERNKLERSALLWCHTSSDECVQTF